MQAKLELRHDAEVAATAADAPEEVGVLILARGDHAAVGEHHLGREQVVDGEPVLAREIAGSSAQGQTCDTRAADDAQRYREAKGVGRVIEIRRSAAWIDAHGAGRRVDPYAAHLR